MKIFCNQIKIPKCCVAAIKWHFYAIYWSFATVHPSIRPTVAIATKSTYVCLTFCWQEHSRSYRVICRYTQSCYAHTESNQQQQLTYFIYLFCWLNQLEFLCCLVYFLEFINRHYVVCLITLLFQIELSGCFALLSAAVCCWKHIKVTPNI